MSTDITLAVLAFLSQFLTAYLGWRVTVDGVQEKRKKLYELLFIIGGLVGALSIGLATYRASAVAGDLASIKAGQKQTNAGISQIQDAQAHQQAVVVNVPPPPKQKAVMALSRNTADDGIQIIHDPQYPQFGWLVNVSCKNVGTITARRVVCVEYTKRIPADGGIPTKQTLEQYWKDFSKKLAEAHPPQSVDLEPGRNSWGSVGLEMLDVDPELNSGGKVIMVAGAILYSDEAGAHKKEFCEWAQPPFNPANSTWHFCEIGHNREVY